MAFSVIRSLSKIFGRQSRHHHIDSVNVLVLPSVEVLKLNKEVKRTKVKWNGPQTYCLKLVKNGMVEEET